MFQASLAGLIAAVLAVGHSSGLLAQEPEPPRFELPTELPIRQVECAVDTPEALEDPAPLFELMKSSREQAVACVALLDAEFPQWHDEPGADELVVPFISYLLGDGTARGLQRHAIFIQLLGHLEKIAPDWRLRDAVEALLPEIILGSLVEDPFVANFWQSALPEIDQQWRDSDAAETVLPTVYQLALVEETDAAGVRNPRPSALLKELSWISHARLVLATKVFDSWPKRILWILLVALLLGFAFRTYRKRKQS